MSTTWRWWSSLNTDWLTPVWRCLWNGTEVGGAERTWHLGQVVALQPPHFLRGCHVGLERSGGWMEKQIQQTQQNLLILRGEKPIKNQNSFALEKIHTERNITGGNNAVYSLPVETPWGRITSLNRSSQVLWNLCSPETRNDLPAVILRCARTSPES